MLQQCVNRMKRLLESSVRSAKFDGRNYSSGLLAKEALIRSQKLINLLHEEVKQSLTDSGISQNRIIPPVGQHQPEMKIAGFLKQKDQDVCVIPANLNPLRRPINWGPLRFEDNAMDEYGQEYSEQTTVINIRSQLSSVAKNTDTLFERTFAESVNLHKVYPKMVLGEVYMIPAYEYDEDAMRDNQITFKNRHTNIEKYISFFTALNDRANENDDISKYEKIALLIVDFHYAQPRIYNSTQELIRDGLVRAGFPLDLNQLSFPTFIPDIIRKYRDRFGS